jgi:hypothetical protein
VVDDHQDFMRHRHGGLLPAQAPFETPKRPAQGGRRFACGPGTRFCRKFSFEVICRMISPYDPR